MTFLTVLLWITAVIVLIILAVLFLPVGADIKFKDDFSVKITFIGIKVYEIKPEIKKGHKVKTETKEQKPTEKKKNTAKKLFRELKEKHGFTSAVKKVMAYLKDCLVHIKSLLRHIKIEKIRLNLIYGGNDAADTAVKYGEICSAVYPVLSLLDTAKNISFKKINVASDFQTERADFDFSLSVKSQIYFMLLAAFRLYKTYKNFLNEEDLNE